MIRKGGGERCDAGFGGGAGGPVARGRIPRRERIGIQNLGHVSQVFGADGAARGEIARIAGERVRSAWLDVGEPQALVGKKEEQLVLDDRSAQDSAEVILVYSAPLHAGAIEEPVVGVQNGIAKVVEHVAMEGVGSRPGEQQNLASR